jgi:hypothetical protein
MSKSVKSPHHKKGGLLRKFSLRGIRKKGKHQVEDLNNGQPPPHDSKKHKQVNIKFKRSLIIYQNTTCQIYHTFGGE